MANEPRFTVSNGKPIDGSDTFYILDGEKDDYLALIIFEAATADLITSKLNGSRIATGGARTNPRLRPLAAMEIADFRMFLEHENGVPLNQEPDIAMLLDNLCAFLKFNTGERALALGPDLLGLLNRFEDEPSSAIQIVNSDATIPVEDLAINR